MQKQEKAINDAGKSTNADSCQLDTVVSLPDEWITAELKRFKGLLDCPENWNFGGYPRTDFVIKFLRDAGVNLLKMRAANA